MNKNQWLDRLSMRTDISKYLIHLTKPGKVEDESVDYIGILIKILKEQNLEGSTTESGFICGKTKAVCFQETPVSFIGQNTQYESKIRAGQKDPKIRYVGCGLIFPKEYIYLNGGRPVIYDKTENAKQYLPENQWWRIVDFDLSDDNKITDWTHEREWRVPGDLKFDLSKVAIVVPNHGAYQKLIDECRKIKEKDIIREIKSIINLGVIIW